MEAFVPSTPVKVSMKAATFTAMKRSSARHRVSATKGVLIPTKQTSRETHYVTEYNAPGELACATSTVTVVWFRDDLRLHDHPALVAAHERGDIIAPLVVVPEKVTEFWAECVKDLRMNIRRSGGELFVRNGAIVEDVVCKFIEECGANRLHVHRGVMKEDVGLERNVCERLSKMGVTCQLFWTGILRPINELPFRVDQMPEDCDEFSRAVANLVVPPPLPVPKEMRLTTGLEPGTIPDVGNNAVNETNITHGGEIEGLARVQDFVEGRSLASVSRTDENLKDGGRKVGGNVSMIDTKFGRLAPFLSMGCVSPRRVWHDVMDKVSPRCLRRFCAEFDLVLRDFTRLLTLKHGVVPA